MDPEVRTQEFSVYEILREFILFLICVILVSHVTRVFRKNSRHVSFARQLKGPPGEPLIGNSLDFWHGATEGVRKLTQYGQKYGCIYRLWFGKHLLVVLSDVKDIEVVLKKHETGDKPEIFLTFFRKFLGNALSTCPEPNFNLEFDPNEQRMIKFDPNESSKVTFPALNVVMSEMSFTSMFRSWLHVPVLYYLLYHRIEKKIKKHIRIFTDLVLKKNRVFLEEFKKNPTADIPKMPFLKTLYPMQNDILDEDWLRDQITFLAAAGTDGVAVTMSFFLLSIAMNPSIQKNLIDELDDVFNDDREATSADIERLVYLDQVLKETERRYTFLPLIFRNVSVDAEIGSYTFPAGTAIAINIDHVHHDPKYYPNPYEFNPENFSEEAIRNRPPLSFIPFSSGPRNCLGIYYAYLVMKLTLIALLRKFHFETTMTEGSIEINIGFITTNKSGYKVSIKSREKNNKKYI